MPNLPASSAFTGAGVTEGGHKAATADLRDFLAVILGTTGTVPAALSALGAMLNSVSAKTAAYTVVAADRGRLLACSGSWTLSLTAAATLGVFSLAVRNTGTGTITIDPSASETIDGLATLTLNAGQSALLVSDGSNWVTVGRSGSSLIGVQVFVASGTYTPTPGTTKVLVEFKSSGGGGGGGSPSGYYNAGGGGAGGVLQRVLFNCSTSQAVIIGAGGPGGAIGANGSAGGTSSFGALLTVGGAAGGAPGVNAPNSPGPGGVGSSDIYALSSSGGVGVAYNGGPGCYGGAPGTNGVGERGKGGWGGSGADSYGTRASTNGSTSGAGQAGTSGYIIVYEYAE